MKERPVLFSAPMVRALLAGTKTQTRRVCKAAELHALTAVVEVPDPQERGQVYNGSHFGNEEGGVRFACPYGGVGERLWVRETFVQGWPHTADGVPDQFDENDNEKPMQTWYRATSPDLQWSDDGENMGPPKWKPSIFMPRDASRILLEVTEVRVERLQDISEADAKAEGITPLQVRSFSLFGADAAQREATYRRAAVDPYRALWEQINGAGSWATNPWVWVVSFRKVAP